MLTFLDAEHFLHEDIAIPAHSFNQGELFMCKAMGMDLFMMAEQLRTYKTVCLSFKTDVTMAYVNYNTNKVDML